MNDQNREDYTLTIFARRPQGNVLENYGAAKDAGHSWLEVTNNKTGEKTTYGTWQDNKNPHEVVEKNREKKEEAWYAQGQSRSSEQKEFASRSVSIDAEQHKKLEQAVNEYNKNGKWRLDTPCSHFSSTTWEKVTGEKLSDRYLDIKVGDRQGVGTPNKLAEGIEELNQSNSQELSQSENSPQSEQEKELPELNPIQQTQEAGNSSKRKKGRGGPSR